VARDAVVADGRDPRSIIAGVPWRPGHSGASEDHVRAQSLLSCAVLVLALATPVGAAAQNPAAPPGDYAPADIAYGSRIYDAQCTTCHGAGGDGVGGVNLRSGSFRNAITDQDLARVIATGIQGTGMQAFKFDASEMAGIIAYLRNMNSVDRGSVKLGDEARGQALFNGKGGCARCHRVGGQGSRVAPDLSDIGALRSAGSLLRSLTEPTSQMMPINRPVRAVLRDGKVVNGRRLNEDTYTVQLIDDQERLVSLTKTDLREYTILTTSPMPSFKTTFAPDELADVVAYLLSLKGR
jgi:cytochrome c oxidase cbb3-type subunit III